MEAWMGERCLIGKKVKGKHEAMDQPKHIAVGHGSRAGMGKAMARLRAPWPQASKAP